MTGGQVAVHAAAGNLISYKAAEKNDSEEITIIGGWPGDCLIGSYIPPLKIMVNKKLTKWAILSWVFNRGFTNRQMGLDFKPRKFERRLSKLTEKKFRKLVLNCSGFTAAQKISYWAMFLRQPAFSYCQPSNLSTNVLQITPLLSDRYLRELLKLRPNDLIEKNFYRKIFHEFLPELCDIPYAATGLPISNEYNRALIVSKKINVLTLLLPTHLIVILRKIINIFRKIESIVTKNPSPKIASIEDVFWKNIFEKIDMPHEIVINELKIILKNPSLQTKGALIALLFTKTHLSAAKKALTDAK